MFLRGDLVSVFLKSIFDWAPRILEAFSYFANWAQGPIISNPKILDLFDEYSLVFDLPNRILRAIFDLKPIYELSLMELVVPAVIFVVIWTIITWFTNVVS